MNKKKNGLPPEWKYGMDAAYRQVMMECQRQMNQWKGQPNTFAEASWKMAAAIRQFASQCLSATRKEAKQ